MAVKMTVLYPQPDDTAKFDAYYTGTHMPLAEKLPGLVRAEVARVTAGGPYYIITELWFADMDAAMAALGSEVGQQVANDVANFAPPDVVMFFSEIQ